MYASRVICIANLFLLFKTRNGFSPGAPVNLYNTSRCNQRETPSRNNTTPTSSSRYISHSNSGSGPSSLSSGNNIRLKLADCLNQNVIPSSTNQPIKLQINQK